MLRLYLLVLLAFSASLSPVWAQYNPPRAGEIALEGRVTALDAPHDSLSFLVTAFSNRNGRRALITPPKVKVARVSPATVFFQGDNKRSSPGDFKVGEEIVVVGKNGDTAATFEARAVLWSEAQIEKDNLHAPPVIAALLPPPQKAFAATLRPANVKWTRQDAEYNGEEMKEKTPRFTSIWELISPRPQGQNDGFMLYKGKIARLVGLHAPDGTALKSVTQLDRTSRDGKSTQLFLNSADVNPNWPFISAEWEILNPAAPTPAVGRRFSNVTWKKLNLPTRGGQKIAVDRTMTTPNGSEINLVSIRRAYAGGGQPEQYVFEIQVEPGQTAPDSSIEISFDYLKGAKGIYFDKSHISYSYEPGLLVGRNTVTAKNTLLVSSGIVTPKNAGPLSLSLQLRENAVSLQDRSHYKRLRFQIPIAPVWDSAPVPASANSPIYSVETVHVKGQIESARYFSSGGWRALLWLQNSAKTPETEVGTNPESAPENDWSYFLRAAHWVRTDGNAVNLQIHASDENTRFVHLNGMRATPGERSHLLSTWDWAGVPMPKDLTLTFGRGRRLAHSQTLKDIAIPQRKFIETAKSDAKQFFHLRRVFRYQDVREIAGLSDSDQKLLAPAGIAVVLELSPTFPGAEIQTEAVRAIDQDGRQWNDAWFSGHFIQDGDMYSDVRLFHSFTGDVRQPKSRETNQATESTPRYCTVFLPGLGATTKKFSLELSAIETQWSGESETAKVRSER